MKFDRPDSTLLCAAATAICALAASAQTATTSMVSIDSAGTQGNRDSADGSITNDGRFIVFSSFASNLVGGDVNGLDDVFLRDRITGSTHLVSVDSSGVFGNYDSYQPRITPDGRFLVFSSIATNLAPGDLNGTWDIFVRDLQTSTTQLVSLASNGAQSDGMSFAPAITPDGRFIVFESTATNLVPNDTNAAFDIFVRDRSAGTTERMSVGWNGAQGTGVSRGSALSADGRCVAFVSSSGLAPGEIDSLRDVYVRDRQTGSLERISVDPGGAAADSNSDTPSISADGRFVAFASLASNLAPNDTNAVGDIFVRDRATATTERVSVDSAETQALKGSFMPVVSASGRWVEFWSYAPNLAAGNLLGYADVFVRDRAAGITECMSLTAAGVTGDQHSYSAAISADGRFVVFSSFASNLVATDTNNFSDVFLRDRGVLLPVTYCTSGTTTNGCAATITANANPSASLASACNISVANVEGVKSGIVFYGVDNSGFAPVLWAPGSSSWRCVRYPVQRTPLQNSGGTFNACNGSYSLDWNAYQATHANSLGGPWSAGDTVYVQAWFRDPPAVKSTNLSNALELTYGP